MNVATRGLAVLLWAAGLAWTPSPAQAAELTVVLVRHAEKAEDDPRDPALSEAGQARALALAQALAASPPDAIYATHLRRTVQTAWPTHGASGAALSIRSAQEPAADLASHILERHARGTILVVGHSNTLPDIVQALTGVAVPPIDEQEYDRVHVAILSPGTTARLVTFRYGAPSVPPMSE